MSRVDDILTGTQTAIEAHASFTDADVLRRPNLKQDDLDKSLTVFLNIGNPEPLLDAPQVCDMRLYPLEVIVNFAFEGRTDDPTVKDDVILQKGIFSDALKTAMKTLFPSPTVPVSPIANVFGGRWISENLNYEEKADEDLSKSEFKIQQIWHFYTYEG